MVAFTERFREVPEGQVAVEPTDHVVLATTTDEVITAESGDIALTETRVGHPVDPQGEAEIRPPDDRSD